MAEALRDLRQAVDVALHVAQRLGQFRARDVHVAARRAALGVRAQQFDPAHQARQRRAELVRGLFRHAHPDDALLGLADAGEARQPEQQQQPGARHREQRHPAQLLQHGRIPVVQVAEDPRVRGLAQRDRIMHAIQPRQLGAHAVDSSPDHGRDHQSVRKAVERLSRDLVGAHRDAAPRARGAGGVGDDNREADARLHLAQHALQLRVDGRGNGRLRRDAREQLRGGRDFARQAADRVLHEQEHGHHQQAAAHEQSGLEQRLAARRGVGVETDHAELPAMAPRGTRPAAAAGRVRRRASAPRGRRAMAAAPWE